MMTLPPRLSRMSLLLTVLLIAPRLGFAAEQAPLLPTDAPAERSALATAAPLPGTGARPNLRLMDDAPAPEAERPAQDLRVMAEIGAGVLTGAGGLALGYMGMFMLWPTGIGSVGGYGLLAPILVGIGSGLALGTYWGGEVTGGRSDLGNTFLGMLLGGAAGVLISVPSGNPFVSLFACPPLMLLGSLIAYESSEHGGRIQPVVNVSSRGTTFGLAGTF
ncbi:hypothetical protein ACN28E_00095 [Archangium lansingense]|uniref:hypothetical protein n=1 Tax=Archangium lansingense TaxID=2995310 RepID=UPI003B79BA6E